MTDLEMPSERKILTVPNIVLFVGLALNVGGWVRQASYMEERVKALETRVVMERQNSDLIYMRRDVLIEQLRLIQEEQTRLREQLQGLRRDFTR